MLRKEKWPHKFEKWQGDDEDKGKLKFTHCLVHLGTRNYNAF
jgi:hypothetical protein